MERDADFWIHALELKPHPEGGYFRETYRSAERLPARPGAARPGGSLALSTAILFLLRGHDRSRLHRLGADELWHFHTGAALTLHRIEESGNCHESRLGLALERGEQPQVLVRAGEWFGASLEGGSSFALVGCTVAPGFEYQDFELGVRAELVARYPQHRALIERLTD